MLHVLYMQLLCSPNNDIILYNNITMIKTLFYMFTSIPAYIYQDLNHCPKIIITINLHAHFEPSELTPQHTTNTLQTLHLISILLTNSANNVSPLVSSNPFEPLSSETR